MTAVLTPCSALLMDPDAASACGGCDRVEVSHTAESPALRMTVNAAFSVLTCVPFVGGVLMSLLDSVCASLLVF